MQLRLKNTDNIRTTRVKGFLYDYFKSDTPTTFYHNNMVQCGKGKARSFNDLYSLVKNYFPSVTKGNVAYNLMAVILENKKFDDNFNVINKFHIGAIVCSEIKGCSFGTIYDYYTPYDKFRDEIQELINRNYDCNETMSFDDVEQLAINYGKNLLQKKAK